MGWNRVLFLWLHLILHKSAAGAYEAFTNGPSSSRQEPLGQELGKKDRAGHGHRYIQRPSDSLNEERVRGGGLWSMSAEKKSLLKKVTFMCFHSHPFTTMKSFIVSSKQLYNQNQNDENVTEGFTATAYKVTM